MPGQGGGPWDMEREGGKQATMLKAGSLTFLPTSKILTLI